MVIVSISIVLGYIILCIIYSERRKKRHNTILYYYSKALKFGEKEYRNMIKETANKQNWSKEKLKDEIAKYDSMLKHIRTTTDFISGNPILDC